MRSESRSSGCRVRRRSVLLFCLLFSATVATLFLIRGGKSADAADAAPLTHVAATPAQAAVAPAHHDHTPRSASLLDASAAVEYLSAKYTATANDLKRANLVRRHRDKLMLDYTAATDFSRERHISQSCASASLRIATFNLYNVQMKWPTRCGMIARALTEVDADIVALQEVRISAPASKNGHQAAELQQLLLGAGASAGAEVSHPHLVYQRVSTQSEGLEEGIALLSRFPIQRWGIRILLSTAELAQRPPRRPVAVNGASDRSRGGPAVDDEDDSGLVWFSDSGKPPLTVPQDSRVVLYARVLTPSLSASSSSNSPSPVDVFVTHWPVSDREQCTAALQTKHFADRVWNQKASGSGIGSVGAERVPQVLTGDLNVYFDFEWPIDFMFGRVLANAALNKCWSDSFARAFERRDSETESAPFRDSFDSTFPALATTNPHTCSDAQLRAATGKANGAAPVAAASGSLRPCVDAGHTFPQDERADGCRPDRVLVRDALSLSTGGEMDAGGAESGAQSLKPSIQALVEVFASPFGEQRLVGDDGEVVFPSDHRGLLVCFAHAKGESRAALIAERARLRAATAPLHPKSMFEYHPHPSSARASAAVRLNLDTPKASSAAAASAGDTQPSPASQIAAWNMAITCPSARVARATGGGLNSQPAISSFLSVRTNMKPFPRRFRQTYGVACAVDTDARSAFWSAHGVDERHTVTLELQRPLHAFGKLMVLTGLDGHDVWANVSLSVGACTAGAHDPYYTDRYPPDYTNKYIKQSTSVSLNGGGDAGADQTACTSLGVASAVPLAASDYLSAAYRRMHQIAELSGSASSSSSASMSSEYDDRAIVLAETKGASVLQWSLLACQSVVQSPAPAVALVTTAASSTSAPASLHAAGSANATSVVAGGSRASVLASGAVGAGMGPGSGAGTTVAAAAGSPTQAAVRGTAAECGGATRLTLRGANAQAAWALIREIVIFEN